MFSIYENGIQISGTTYLGSRYEGYYSLVPGIKSFPTLEAAKSLLDHEYMRRGYVEIKDQQGACVEILPPRTDRYAKFG